MFVYRYFFFFKQKTAYEMRISDWSSDVCSSDLLDPGLVADDVVAILDRADAADVEPDAGIEFQRVAAGRRPRIAEHDADLHADLIDEDHHGPGAGEDRKSVV